MYGSPLQCGHLRMDTHGDNYVMQNLLKKSGFVHCGTVYVEEDDHPRMAYEKIPFAISWRINASGGQFVGPHWEGLPCSAIKRLAYT